MTAVRLARLLAMTIIVFVFIHCGETYRPVAMPQSPNPPNPQFSHIAVVLSSNGSNNPGAATTIDVSGDTAISQLNTGLNPAHAALLLSGTRIYIANRGDDTVSSFPPESTATPIITSLPTGSAPTFVASTQTAVVYIANSGNNTVSVVNTTTNVVTSTIAVGTDPVAMAELPNGNRLYVANAGTGGAGGSISSINTVDYSVNLPLAGATWVSPAWLVARNDNQRLFVLDKGAGTVVELNTSGTVDTLIGSVNVGIGAEFMIYDSTLSRLYVTNPVSGMVYVLDASDSASGGMISSLAAIPVPGAVSVAALPDGSRFYVASAIAGGGNVSSSITIVNAVNFTVKKTLALTNVPLTCPAFANTPFDLFAVAAADSSRVYAGNCDAESTAIVATNANTTPGSGTAEDTLVTDLAAPLSAQSPGNGGAPPPQNPVFVVAGP